MMKNAHRSTPDQHYSRRKFLAWGTCSLAGIFAAGQLLADENGQLREPVYRVSNANPDVRGDANLKKHPLDPALEIAYNGLKRIREQVGDYQCVLVKRERIAGELGNHEYMFAKVRNEKVRNGSIVQPFSVYMYFLKPTELKGREVMYVKGKNDDKMIAHEGRNSVLGKFPSIWLRPDGPIAMKGQLYPITEVGIENLIVRLIEKGERDRQRDECLVEFRKGGNINGRKCTMLQVTHPVPRPYFDFHIARVFIDDEFQVPIRYAAYTWPAQSGGEPVLVEEYTYLNLELNKGFADRDFDHENPDYNF